MPAEIHQLGVDVCGHTAVGRRGKVGAAGHHAGTARRGTFSTPLHQGTKSRKGEENSLKGNFPASPPTLKHSNLKQDFHKGYHGKCSSSYVPANSLTVVVSPVCELQKKKKKLPHVVKAEVLISNSKPCEKTFSASNNYRVRYLPTVLG